MTSTADSPERAGENARGSRCGREGDQKAPEEEQHPADPSGVGQVAPGVRDAGQGEFHRRRRQTQPDHREPRGFRHRPHGIHLDPKHVRIPAPHAAEEKTKAPAGKPGASVPVRPIEVTPTPRPVGVGDPYTELHDHRLCLAVDRDFLAVGVWDRPVEAFPLDPLREGLQAPLERLLCLAGPSPHVRLQGREAAPGRVLRSARSAASAARAGAAAQVAGCFCCCSHRSMSSPSMRTPGAMSGRTPSASIRSARTRWWRC